MSQEAVEQAPRESFKPLIRDIAEVVGTDDSSYALSKAVEIVNKHAPTIAAAIREDAVREWREAFADYIDARLGVINAETIDDRVSTMTRHAEAFTAIRALLDREKEG